MAIVSVSEQPEGWDGSQNEKGEYEFTRVFFVLTDSFNTGAYEVLNAAGVPGRGDDYHAGDDALTYCWVKNKKAKRDSIQPKLWYVTVQYSSSKETQDGSSDTNPLLRPQDERWGTQKYQKIIEKDVYGADIGSSANEPFNPRVEVDDFHPTLTVTRNVASPYNNIFWTHFINRVNSDEFRGYEVGQGKIADVSAVKTIENSYTFYRQTIEIEFNLQVNPTSRVPIGWNIRRLDEGSYYYVGGTSKRVFRDADGNLMQSGLLDGAGGLGSAGSPQYREFFGYRTIAFSLLGI